MSLPPGPRLPKAVQTALFAGRLLPFLHSCRRRYGDIFTLRVALFGDIVYLGDPELVRQVFTGDPNVFRAGAANAFMEPMLGARSVLLLDEPDHLAMRRLMLPPFHGASVRRYEDLIREIALREVVTWPVGRTFPLRPRMQSITLEVILRAVFGVRDAARLERLRALLTALLDSATIALYLPWLRRDLLGLGPWARFRRLRDQVDELLLDEIDRRRRSEAPDSRDDILSLLLSARDDEGRGLSDRELRDELMTLLAAGHETTATALAWAFERLVRHPAALRCLTAELVDGGGDYLDAVIEETLRVRPVVLDVARTLSAPARVGDYDLPAGTMVVPGIALVQSSPRVFDAAAAFRPERFLEGQAEPYTMIPFGGGVRRCLGAPFATMEMRVVIAAVLSRVVLAAPDQAPEAQRLRNVTLAPARGARVVVERRLAPASHPAAQAVGATS